MGQLRTDSLEIIEILATNLSKDAFQAFYRDEFDNIVIDALYFSVNDDTFTVVDNEEYINEMYKKYHALVNMSASELERWSKNPCSSKASLSKAPIERNLRILRTPKKDWTVATARSAARTVSFISRMRGAEQGGDVSDECKISKRDISLLNWGYNPSK